MSRSVRRCCIKNYAASKQLSLPFQAEVVQVQAGVHMYPGTACRNSAGTGPHSNNGRKYSVNLVDLHRTRRAVG
jgi:hypothetical protein